MDVDRLVRKKVVIEYESSRYLHNLSMYKQKPTVTIQLQEFEKLAIDRLRTLRIIDYATNNGYAIYSLDWKNFIIQELKKEHLNKYEYLLEGNMDKKTTPHEAFLFRRDDHLSHHILCLAYCNTEELRKWFLNREVDLFRLRLWSTSLESIDEFMQINDLKYPLVCLKERQKYWEKICTSTVDSVYSSACSDNSCTPFYKIPFTHVLELCQEHEVFVRDGYAFVPHYELRHCILHTFKETIRTFLIECSNRNSKVMDKRFAYFLESIHQYYPAIRTYSAHGSMNQGHVTLGNIDEFAINHFPLCMTQIHDAFRQNHHLRHNSRVQYLFFLKGLGMLFEDVMEFWRDEFTKRIDTTQFEKQYAYSVKHAFGMVGSKMNIPPYSCGKILSKGGSSSDTHGCPFMTWDESYMKDKLEAKGISGPVIHEILQKKKAGHFQLGCRMFLQSRHDGEPTKHISHPNQFFDESFEKRNKDEFEWF